MPCSSSLSRNVFIGLLIAIDRTPFRATSRSGPPRADSPPSHQPLDSDPHERHRDEHLPSEAHDLVVAIAWKCGTEPQKKAQQHENLQHQPVAAWRAQARVADAWIVLQGTEPAAEEEYRGQAGDQ